MGRNSSGTRGGLQPGDSSYKGSIKNVESLIKIKDPQVYKEVTSAIARFHSVLGVRERNVKLADLSAGTLGVQTTSVATGQSTGVYINKKVFNQKKKAIVAQQKKGYDSGWSTKTNKPIAHVITHELGHALWNSDLGGANHKAAGKDINKLYNSWLKDKKKKGYGQYSKSNVDEFWAELVTKAVHGTADKYTKRAKSIAKKHGL